MTGPPAVSSPSGRMHQSISCKTEERFKFIDLGFIEYQRAYEEQLRLLQQVTSQRHGDVVLFAEHAPVITIGRCGKESDVLPVLIERNPDSSGLHSRGGNPAIPIIKTDRGGGTTFHTPGQLVIYPIIALRPVEQRIRWLLGCYEEIIIQLLSYFGIGGHRQPGRPGVWTSQGKIASIGVTLKRWVTYHGIALNVNNDLSGFDLIIPCGIPDCRFTSMKQVLGREISIAEVKSVARAIFPAVWKTYTPGKG